MANNEETGASLNLFNAWQLKHGMREWSKGKVHWYGWGSRYECPVPGWQFCGNFSCSIFQCLPIFWVTIPRTTTFVEPCSIQTKKKGHHTIVLSLLAHLQNKASRIKLFKIDFLLIVIVAFVSSQLRTKFVTCYSPSAHDVLSHIYLHCSFGSGWSGLIMLAESSSTMHWGRFSIAMFSLREKTSPFYIKGGSLIPTTHLPWCACWV